MPEAGAGDRLQFQVVLCQGVGFEENAEKEAELGCKKNGIMTHLGTFLERFNIA